jgi:hypothetical protein
MKDVEILRRHSSSLSKMAALKFQQHQLTLLKLEDTEFKWYPVIEEDFAKSLYLEKILRLLCDSQPADYEHLLAVRGVGPKTVRALALVGEVIYAAKPSYEDPARYSFAHGGKDATPYPVDRATYDRTIQVLKEAVQHCRLSPYEKDQVVRRLKSSSD